MNKYESNIKSNTIIMKIMFVIIAIVNAVLPYQKDGNWKFNLFQLAVIVVWVFGLLGGLGYFAQDTPILPIGIVRIVEAGYFLLFRFNKVNWIIFGIYVLLDVIFMVFLLFDKANYYYEEIEEDEENES